MKVGDLVKYKDQFANMHSESDKPGVIIKKLSTHANVAFGEILMSCHQSMIEVINESR